MNNKLRDLFQQPFDLETYRRVILSQLLHAQRLLTSPELLEQYDNGDQLYGLGYLTDNEGKEIGLYYTHVHSGDVRRKRVGFRKMLHPYVKYGVDAAIAVFDDGEYWRLSYICDLKGGVTSAKRFSYVFGDPKGQYNTPVGRLTDLGKKRLTLDELHKTFSVDALSKEFFDEYHRHYDRIIAELSRQGNTGAVFHDYVKKMMGRIVFLHFLQKKRWLNDDPEFLSKLFFLSPYKQDFLDQELEPLFFGIFNTEPDKREQLFSQEHWDLRWLAEWEKMPYLNGGLFERDEVDKMKIKLPASLFENLFRFMASYNFTIDENDPDDADIGIDPEMLGKIFESLLEDNKAKGAFYTPKEIVRYMCKESLIAYLNSKVSSESTGNQITNHDSLVTAVRQFVEQHEFPEVLEPYREVLDTALREVKICDPAIGSGAFPMGLLNELWRCREALIDAADTSERCDFNNPAQATGVATEGSNLVPVGVATEGSNTCAQCGDSTAYNMRAGGTRPQSRAALKKQIIENNIYGVDIEKGAIDIARLRFWLSIVVDAGRPEPLPNFDYKFMQGNSLIESFGGFDLSHIMESGSRPLPGRGVRRAGWAENQTGMEFASEETKQNLHNWLKRYFSETDHKEKAIMRENINTSVKNYILQQGISPATEAKLKQMNPSANKDFFLWHTWFKDIFDNGGFDIVIGNPPYISAPTQIANVTLAKQRERIVFSKRYKTLYQKWDIYIPFIELGIMLNVPLGVTTMIVPFPLTNQLYAKVLRKMLIEDYNMYELVDLNGTKIFENATVSNCIPFVRKAKPLGKTWISNINEDLVIKRSFQQSHEDLVQDKKTYVWNVTQEKRETNRHSKMHVLGDYCYISKGMVLNSDEKEDVLVFRKADLISEKKDNVHCRKFIEGKDCGKYVANRIRYLEYDTERVPDKCSRPTFRELYLNPKLMFNRLGELQVFYDEYGDFTTSDAMFVCLLWKSLVQVNNKSISASIKKFCSFPRHELEKLSEDVDLRYLLGIMNSKYAAVLLTNLRGGDYHIYPEHIRNIPIPNPSKSQQQLIINIVDKILSAKKDNPQSNTSALEHEIDQQVYALYNLTPEEIDMIEQ